MNALRSSQAIHRMIINEQGQVSATFTGTYFVLPLKIFYKK